MTARRDCGFLMTYPVDPSLEPGARNAVQVCLRVGQEEKLTLITDEATLETAAALAREVARTGARWEAFVLEDFTERPMTQMPSQVLQSLESSQVSIFAAQAGRRELRARMEMTAIINRQRIRHAHMVNINPRIMREGMRADYHQVDDLSRRLIERARQAETIRATSSGGTHLVARFSPRLKWVKTSGIIGQDKWGNLPGGEIFTSPAQVDGVFVVDGVVGDYLCSKYGDLQETPLHIHIERSRIRALECRNRSLLEEFQAYTSVDENSNRVGEFAIGTNLSVRDVIGNILQDEKIPGVHIAFGHPYGEHTGQSWFSSTHIDCVGRCFDIWMDGEHVMEKGRFLV